MKKLSNDTKVVLMSIFLLLAFFAGQKYHGFLLQNTLSAEILASPAAMGSDIQKEDETKTDAISGEDPVSPGEESAEKTDPPSENEKLVNLNTATAQELMTLPGVGEKRAQAILEYREAKGGLENVEQMLEVPGIGEATLEKIRSYVYVGESI